MKTDECKESANRYLKMFEEKFGKKEQQPEEKKEEQNDFPKMKKTYTYRQCVAIKPQDLAL